ncbi:putative lipid II flippase FtsW [Candidatus Falkowbacteria bacterium CG10_big_fil_rev_8_21_14_0_10_43_10]|uniref:Probable peptidoglycan glycosyltransferase FtsW n=1 Tax=Candidatus Falkowbacteria bacterium CG10_big_fil_rev_8_21_14_0_10_43_10 TaxID=1974567 RepID=A0A2H0V1R8_9BACT|nr:MAG: putative lipid II flippase FtsW [Candidatus Falkowbacteria bacterium CG10_big_fil_rev_8_21_14_0_10_43_10]
MFQRRRLQRIKMLLSGFIHERANYHQPDFFIIITVLAIIIFGLIMLSSASSAISYARYQSSYYYFNHQLFGLGLGLILFYGLSRFDYHRFRNAALLLLVGSLGLLLIVFIPALSAGWGHAKSWINIFGFSLQPSEFVKLTFLLYLAAWIEKRGKELFDLHQGTMPFISLLMIISFLMLMQPDTGTLFILLAISLTVYFIGGGNIKHIASIGAVGIIVLFILLKMAPYQMDRFRCFFDPSYSPDEYCYQVNQSLIAAGSGGLLGRGFGNSRQKFRYLPEAQGDAIFPIIAEEMGMVISVFLVMLFLFLFYRGFLVSQRAPDIYGQLLAIGVISWFCLQAFLNIGGMINLIPMTGVPLPFISYGGSAMMAALAGAGILVNISKQTK